MITDKADNEIFASVVFICVHIEDEPLSKLGKK